MKRPRRRAPNHVSSIIVMNPRRRACRLLEIVRIIPRRRQLVRRPVARPHDHAPVQQPIGHARKHGILRLAPKRNAAGDENGIEEKPHFRNADITREKLHEGGAVIAVGNAADKTGRLRRRQVFAREKRNILLARRPGQTLPIPDGEDVVVFVAGVVEMNDAVAKVLRLFTLRSNKL